MHGSHSSVVNVSHFSRSGGGFIFLSNLWNYFYLLSLSNVYFSGHRLRALGFLWVQSFPHIGVCLICIRVHIFHSNLLYVALADGENSLFAGESHRSQSRAGEHHTADNDIAYNDYGKSS